MLIYKNYHIKDMHHALVILPLWMNGGGLFWCLYSNLMQIGLIITHNKFNDYQAGHLFLEQIFGNIKSFDRYNNN